MPRKFKVRYLEEYIIIEKFESLHTVIIIDVITWLCLIKDNNTV
jgi:hypothetical protein